MKAHEALPLVAKSHDALENICEMTEQHLAIEIQDLVPDIVIDLEEKLPAKSLVPGHLSRLDSNMQYSILCYLSVGQAILLHNTSKHWMASVNDFVKQNKPTIQELG